MKSNGEFGARSIWYVHFVNHLILTLFKLNKRNQMLVIFSKMFFFVYLFAAAALQQCSHFIGVGKYRTCTIPSDFFRCHSIFLFCARGNAVAVVIVQFYFHFVHPFPFSLFLLLACMCAYSVIFKLNICCLCWWNYGLWSLYTAFICWLLCVYCMINWDRRWERGRAREREKAKGKKREKWRKEWVSECAVCTY